jgi:hypothetical protein
MHTDLVVSRFAISAVLLLGLLFSNSAFADAGGELGRGKDPLSLFIRTVPPPPIALKANDVR